MGGLVFLSGFYIWGERCGVFPRKTRFKPGLCFFINLRIFISLIISAAEEKSLAFICIIYEIFVKFK